MLLYLVLLSPQTFGELSLQLQVQPLQMVVLSLHGVQLPFIGTNAGTVVNSKNNATN